jgi:2,4-dienoyl-CoA reductase (NADPH2)
MDTDDIIFTPLEMRNLTIKNRVLRSSISGRIDNDNGTGTQARINWEVKLARGGIGAIISSHVPVHPRGRILPNYAFIDRDEMIPFWRRVGILRGRSTARRGRAAAIRCRRRRRPRAARRAHP